MCYEAQTDGYCRRYSRIGLDRVRCPLGVVGGGTRKYAMMLYGVSGRSSYLLSDSSKIAHALSFKPGSVLLIIQISLLQRGGSMEVMNIRLQHRITSAKVGLLATEKSQPAQFNSCLLRRSACGNLGSDQLPWDKTRLRRAWLLSHRNRAVSGQYKVR